MFHFVKVVILVLGLNFAASAQSEISLEGEAANEVMDFVSSRLGTQQQTTIEDQVKKMSVKGEDFSAYCIIRGARMPGCYFAGPIERSINGTRVSVLLSKSVSDDIIKQLDILGVPSFQATEYNHKHFRLNVDCFKSIDTSPLDFTGVALP